MHHDLGLVTSVLLPVLWPGLTAVLLPAKAFAARPNRWMSLVARYGAVITAGPNTALELAARQARRLEPGTDLSSLQCLVTGAEPVRPDTVRRFESALAPYGMPAGTVKPAYGMAEATLLVSMATAGLRTRRLDPSSKRSGHARPAAPGAPGVEVASVGKAAPGAQVRIRSDGPSTPEGIIGPVEVRTPSACDGYVGDDAASAALFSEDGWLRTGDLGFIDRGELYITGRSKDTIIVAGQNIEPVDLEQLALQAAPEAIGVAAVGRESRQGETPCVLIEMRHRSTTSAQVDVQRHIAAVLGLAVDVICVAPGALPRTSSGKVQRRAAVSLLADDSTQDTRSRTPARDGVMA
jgi:acyl-CoA synthetase (AMP-forming)/AMP-acid ligase II